MEHDLDARDLVCPMPVLRARKALKSLAAGDRLVIRVTDPAAPEDFRVFCEATGHVLAGIEPDAEEDDVTVVRIDKAAD
ncbi:MAG: sulfurtransferase TusA family protein [Azospirillaceae bacterium]